jgi:hypothetical protein
MYMVVKDTTGDLVFPDNQVTYHVTKGVGYLYLRSSSHADAKWVKEVIGAGDHRTLSPDTHHVLASSQDMEIKRKLYHLSDALPPQPFKAPGPDVSQDLLALQFSTGHKYDVPRLRPDGFFKVGANIRVHLGGDWYQGKVSSAITNMPSVGIEIPGKPFTHDPLILIKSPTIWPVAT